MPKISLQLHRKAILPRPAFKMSIVRLPGPLSLFNPFHLLLRVWWLFLDPVSARAYPNQYGRQHAERLDWWIACEVTFWVGIAFIIFSFPDLAGPTQGFTPYLLVIGLVFIFFTIAVLGLVNLGVFHFFAALLLGLFASLILNGIGLGIPTCLHLLEGAFSQFGIGGFGLVQVQAADLSPQAAHICICVLAGAMAITYQVPGRRSSKPYGLLLMVLIMSAFLYWWSPALHLSIQQTLVLFFATWLIVTIFLKLPSLWMRLVYAGGVAFLLVQLLKTI